MRLAKPVILTTAPTGRARWSMDIVYVLTHAHKKHVAILENNFTRPCHRGRTVGFVESGSHPKLWWANSVHKTIVEPEPRSLPTVVNRRPIQLAGDKFSLLFFEPPNRFTPTASRQQRPPLGIEI